MAQQSRAKTFHYKRAVTIGADPKPLSGLILAAHKKEKRPLKRAMRLGAENDNVRLVNQCYARGEMVVGVMLDYTEGGHQPVIAIGEEDLELAISQLPPREKEQFLEGMLYFGVQGNHVVVIQSKSVRSAEFEKYVNWWLSDSGFLDDGAYISLDNEPSRAAKEKLSGVRSVTLRAPVSPDILRHAAEESPNKRGLTGSIKARIWEILQTEGVFGETAKADAAMAIEDIELSLEIRRRGKEKEGPSLLDDLAHSLRNVDDDVFELQTKAGTIRGADLKVAATKSVKTHGSVPELADVAEKMQDWLAHLIDERQVTEDV